MNPTVGVLPRPRTISASPVWRYHRCMALPVEGDGSGRRWSRGGHAPRPACPLPERTVGGTHRSAAVIHHRNRLEWRVGALRPGSDGADFGFGLIESGGLLDAPSPQSWRVDALPAPGAGAWTRPAPGLRTPSAAAGQRWDSTCRPSSRRRGSRGGAAPHRGARRLRGARPHASLRGLGGARVPHPPPAEGRLEHQPYPDPHRQAPFHRAARAGAGHGERARGGRGDDPGAVGGIPPSAAPDGDSG